MKLCPPGSIVSEGGGKQLSCGQFSVYCILCRCGGLEFQQKEDGRSGQSYLFQEIGIQDKSKKIKYKCFRLKTQMIPIHFGSKLQGIRKMSFSIQWSYYHNSDAFRTQYNKTLIHYSFVIIVYVACILLIFKFSTSLKYTHHIFTTLVIDVIIIKK